MIHLFLYFLQHINYRYLEVLLLFTGSHVVCFYCLLFPFKNCISFLYYVRPSAQKNLRGFSSPESISSFWGLVDRIKEGDHFSPIRSCTGLGLDYSFGETQSSSVYPVGKARPFQGICLLNLKVMPGELVCSFRAFQLISSASYARQLQNLWNVLWGWSVTYFPIIERWMKFTLCLRRVQLRLPYYHSTLEFKYGCIWLCLTAKFVTPVIRENKKLSQFLFSPQQSPFA